MDRREPVEHRAQQDREFERDDEGRVHTPAARHLRQERGNLVSGGLDGSPFGRNALRHRVRPSCDDLLERREPVEQLPVPDPAQALPDREQHDVEVEVVGERKQDMRRPLLAAGAQPRGLIAADPEQARPSRLRTLH